MAKRSDFAQKLLDDLRRRKERMAQSQSSNHSSMISGAIFSLVHDQAEKYGNTAQVYKGYKETKTHESMSLGTQSTQKSSARGVSRSQTRKETSNQIVTLGRAQRPEQIGNLSMALAFALENGGKFKGMESSGNSSTISFLHHIGWRSVETVNIEKRNKLDRHLASTSFTTLSHLHLQEISRGAQKINQILRACSSSVNIDRYSIDIGKELLMGAMELEESLRMLVNLQEASEFMISPHSQRKNMIRLLDADEDDDESSIGVVDKNQVALPRFTFDKPWRNHQGTQEAAKAGINQTIMALTYPTAARAISNNLQEHNVVPVNSLHKHSLSSGPDLRTFSATTGHKGHCSPTPTEDKRKIPNVIAKLMGLDELPRKGHPKNIGQTELSSKKVTGQMVLKTTASRTTKNAEIKKVTEDLATQKSRQNDTQTKRVPASLSKVLELQAEENQVKENTTLNSTVQHLESTECTKKLVAGSKNETLKRNKQENSKIPLTVITGNKQDNHENEKRRDTMKLNEHKGMELARTEVQVLKGELQEIESWQPIRETANAMHDLTGKREHMPQKEKRNVNRLSPGNQPKTNKDLALQQPQILRNTEPQEQEPQTKEAEQKNKHHVRRQKGSEGATKFLPKSAGDAPSFQKKLLRLDKPTADKTGSREVIHTIASQGTPNSINQNTAKDITAADQVGKNNSKHRGMDEDTLVVNLKAESERNKASFPPVIKLKSAHLFPTNQKVNNTKANKSEIPQKIAEVMTRKPGPLRMTSSLLKHQLPNVPATKQKKHGKTSSMKGTEEVTAIKSRATEAFIRSTELEENNQSDSGHNVHIEAEQPHTLSHAREDDHIPTTLAEDKHLTNAKSSISSDPQVHALLMRKEQGQKCQENGIVLAIGTLEESSSSKFKYKYSRTEVQEPLTEDEEHLKQILIKSQIFLNTAEALFKLNIPVSILRAGIDSCQDEESKTLLDCAYEIMKRKGRRNELAVHPFVKIPFGSSKVRSLDDLVKQLHQDFEVSKARYSNGNNERDTFDYLHEMLERDAQNKHPDTNAMWDFGWNQMMNMFLEKDEVAIDVEKHILNGLLDEATIGFLHVSISS
ncbi:DUF3741-associated sequence motif [Dillenia turbinata]|uniref:DUF3741-associated sequence motif n=1 Tax=Dillenia turbinata TaxID=194707 RepID=A0AAN8VXC0_9MAGN